MRMTLLDVAKRAERRRTRIAVSWAPDFGLEVFGFFGDLVWSERTGTGAGESYLVGPEDAGRVVTVRDEYHTVWDRKAGRSRKVHRSHDLRG